MKVAVIGSRTLQMESIGPYLPKGTDELVSGGAKGVDECVREYAQESGIKLTEFLPDYPRYGRVAPLVRNREIVRYADYVVAIWDGKSRGTRFVIDECKVQDKPYMVIFKKGS